MIDMSLRQRNTNISGDTAGLLLRKYDKNELLRASTPTIHPRSVRRLLLKSSMLAVLLAIAILIFGTVYSKLTSRNACQVLRDFRRDDELPDLPRLFHFQSKTRDITKETKTWMEVLSMDPIVQEYPDIIVPDSSSAWTAVYWSDESCKRLVGDHFPTFLQTFDSFPRNIQRVDSCRYLILSMYGGVYADTDISIHTSNANEFEHLIPEGIGLVESPYRYNEMWQNSLMTASYSGHILWNITIEIIEERRDKNNAVLSLTGPKMIGDAVGRFRQRYAHDSSVKQDIQTLPCELFQRLPQGNWNTTWLNVLGREVLARAVPMQGCGKYGDGACEITRHNGRASWTTDAGIT